ncbi:autoinducer 2 ABC transporter substrate-binding protein [Cohnella cholangitidis]|uniref:Autoinducer 2 ABC transporter substrate-binding protein n=1 Tax=Cohnella cholangitidis TaxID=2598458 RepID=A0A7G5C0I2_9BACL|nr:autoinducer 2 ABC transporter substrate-binding protein [Cohnella cholangitidis]QMV42716.1 autoinducer 2 ABC transporter substrate-binding protein [Cohnella cholangitidis]
MYRTIATLLIIALFLASCQSGSSTRYELVYSMESGTAAGQQPVQSKAPGKRYKIGFVPKGSEIDYFQYAALGAREAGNSLGIDVILSGPATADADRQIQVVEQLIDRKVDLIAISANDPVKLVPVLQKARKNGIKVITWDADTEPQCREFFVNMVEPEVLGRHLLDTLALSMGEKGNFAIMTGSFAAANLNEWLKWINVQQSEYYPDMNLVATVATDDDQDKAYEVAKKLLSDYPDLDGIIGNSSVGPPAAAQAVKEAGKSGSVKVVGLSSPNLMGPYLRDGSAQVATLWSPKKLGYLTIVLAYNYLNGQMPIDGQEIEGVGNIRLNGDMVIMGEPLDFTAENVSQYDF